MGVSLADDAIIGITQRIVRGPAGLASAAGPFFSASQLPCFHPIPESQPVLPCLLRRCGAARLCSMSWRGPRCAE